MELILLILVPLLPALFAYMTRSVACALIIAAIPGAFCLLTSLRLWEETRVTRDCATGLIGLFILWAGAGFSCLITLVVAKVMHSSQSPESKPPEVGFTPDPSLTPPPLP